MWPPADTPSLVYARVPVCRWPHARATFFLLGKTVRLCYVTILFRKTFKKSADKKEDTSTTENELKMFDSRHPGMNTARLNKIQSIVPSVPLL